MAERQCESTLALECAHGLWDALAAGRAGPHHGGQARGGQIFVSVDEPWVALSNGAWPRVWTIPGRPVHCDLSGDRGSTVPSGIFAAAISGTLAVTV
jgi:hypothetical protein